MSCIWQGMCVMTQLHDIRGNARPLAPQRNPFRPSGRTIHRLFGPCSPNPRGRCVVDPRRSLLRLGRYAAQIRELLIGFGRALASRQGSFQSRGCPAPLAPGGCSRGSGTASNGSSGTAVLVTAAGSPEETSSACGAGEALVLVWALFVKFSGPRSLVEPRGWLLRPGRYAAR
jgi:hypothetical protein